MAESKFMIAAALKGQQWERCKGELRALVALQGSYPIGTYETPTKWEELEKVIEDFINNVEANALQE